MIKTWTPALAVGVSEMDDDHRKLLEMLAQMHAAAEQGDQARAQSVLAELLDYTDWHFRREGELMATHQYEFTLRHLNEHDDLRHAVQGFVHDLPAGGATLADICAFMRRWLLTHIAGSDRHLGEAIAAARLRAAG